MARSAEERMGARTEGRMGGGTRADVLTDWLRIMGASGTLLARSRHADAWGMRLAESDGVIFHIVTEGACWLRREGETPLRLLQGDLVLLPHGSTHDLVHEPDGEAVALEELLALPPPPPLGDGPFTTVVCGTYRSDAHLARPMLRTLPALVHVPASRVRASPPLASTLALLGAELDRPGPGSDVLIQHLFDALFLYVLRTWIDEADADRPGWLAALKDPALSRALERMHADPGAPWTVEALAEAAHLSRAAFARRFADKVGQPPMAYLTEWRMGLAARWLLESDAALAEVADRVGYESEFAFSRAFKRSRGVAPTPFRRAVRS